MITTSYPFRQIYVFFNSIYKITLDLLTCRDLAFLTWFAILFLFMIIHKDIRGALLNVIKSFFIKQIIIPISASAIYIIICISAFYPFELSPLTFIKTILLWFFTTFFIFLKKYEQLQKNIASNTIKIIKSNVALFFILSFYINMTSFNFLIEFLLFPFIFILSAISISSKKHNTPQVKRIADYSLLIIFISEFLHTTYLSVIAPSEYINKEHLLDLLTPLVLTIIYSPFLFVMVVYYTYKDMINSLRLIIPNKLLFFYTIITTPLFFNIQTNYCNRWLKYIRLEKPETIHDINDSLKFFKNIKRIEKNASLFTADKGWNPNDVILYLSKYNLTPSDYNPVKKSIFSTYASRAHDDINSLVTMSYYIRGTLGCAKSLTLKFCATNIKIHPKDSPTRQKVIQSFLKMAQELWKNALDSPLPVQLLEPSFSAVSVEIPNNRCVSKIKYEEFETGYAVSLILLKDNWNECD